MSVMDDFNRFAFERAKGRYVRAQYDHMTTDDWVALVEGYKAQAEGYKAQVEENAEKARMYDDLCD